MNKREATFFESFKIALDYNARRKFSLMSGRKVVTSFMKPFTCLTEVEVFIKSALVELNELSNIAPERWIAKYQQTGLDVELNMVASSLSLGHSCHRVSFTQFRQAQERHMCTAEKLRFQLIIGRDVHTKRNKYKHLLSLHLRIC